MSRSNIVGILSHINRVVIKYVPMMKTRYGCAICGKGIQRINLVSFSKNRVHRFRRPNLHSHKMEVGGEMIKVRLCTSCKREMRMLDKEMKVVKPAVLTKAK